MECRSARNQRAHQSVLRELKTPDRPQNRKFSRQKSLETASPNAATIRSTIDSNGAKGPEMKAAAPLVIAAILVASAQFVDAGHGVTWSFERDAAGATPNGFREEVGKWRIVETEGRKVIAQQAESPEKVFNIVLGTVFSTADVDLSVNIKAVAGKLDQGGGLIWRAKDKSNYYVARYNPLEDNFRVYKVERGKRTMFKNADIPHTPGWHRLRVTMQGKHIECFYDGKKYLECDDATFPAAGMIGLWTKADAQSYFSDLQLVTSS
jgi:hypothetical protein